MMRQWLVILGILSAYGVMAARFDVERSALTFKDKSTDSIISVGSALTYTSCTADSFLISGSMAQDTTFFTPYVNVGNGGTWTATFTATEAVTLTGLDVVVGLCNSSGVMHSDSLKRGIELTAQVGEQTASATQEWSEGGAETTVALRFDSAVTLAENATLTLECKRSVERGTFVGIRRIGLMGELSKNESFSMKIAVTLPNPLADGELFALTGSGTGSNTKGFWLKLEGGALKGVAAGHGGVKKSSLLLSTPTAGAVVQVCIVYAFVEDNNNDRVRMAATGGAVVNLGNEYNFTNGSDFVTLTLAEGVRILSTLPMTAWDDAAILAQLDGGETSDVPTVEVWEIVEEETWTAHRRLRRSALRGER